MKKKCITLLIILLMINFLIIESFAEEAPQSNSVQNSVENTENSSVEQQELVPKSEVIESTYGRIIEAKSATEVVSDNIKDKVQEVTVEITEGEYEGEEYTTNYVLSYDIEGKIFADELEVGDKVTVQITEDAEGNVTVTVMDVVRAGYIIWLFAIFLLSVVLVGGKSGIKAILGLLYTIILIYFVMVKGIFKGDNAILNSVITCMLIIVGTFVIIGNGINRKIITAALGTLGGVLSAGIVAMIFNNIAKMTGACEDAIQLSINMTKIDFNFRHLLFAGIIVAALGACMDVGMSISSSLDEIKIKNPDITGTELFKSGMNIGRDVIGTMTNTLILAYVGGSLTLILLFMACNMTVIEILNKETIAEQIISALAGSMGVVFTVPITSFIYSILNKDKVIYKKTSENKVNGKRSLKL